MCLNQCDQRTSGTPRGRDSVEVRSQGEAPAGKRYVLWAVSPDQMFTRVGQIVNTGNRNEAEIRGEVALQEFGLLITTEDATESPSPRGAVVGTVYFEPTN
jgi:hypothetical protein